MERHIQISTNVLRTKLKPTVMSPLTAGEPGDFGFATRDTRDNRGLPLPG